MYWILTFYQLNKNKLASMLFIFLSLCIPFPPLEAFEYSDYLLIDTLVRSCYSDTESCESALIKIHSYQENAAINKKFSCQTRLLGLEANLIMAMDSNLKKKEATNIMQAVKKFCYWSSVTW